MLSRRLRRAALLCACATPLAVTAISNALAANPAACMIDLAKTRNGTLGLPIRAQMTLDGRSALFVRSGPSDTRLHLYRYDLADHSTHELAAPAAGPATLSVAAKARRERARPSMSGIAEYQLSDDGNTAPASEGGPTGRALCRGGV